MPKLACRACGRQVYTVGAIDTLFAEERRCPRCGAVMERERREHDRRGSTRRVNPADAPGPPADEPERRAGERRTHKRRAADGGGRHQP